MAASTEYTSGPGTTFISYNITIHRVISYNNGYTGIQINGNVSNLVEDQNMSYGNLIANYSWENGVHDSFFRSNLSFNWGSSGGLVISEYNGNESQPVCGPGRDRYLRLHAFPESAGNLCV